MTRVRRLLEPVNWKYAVGELFLIVAGILIALGANAWYGERVERRHELELLSALRNELRADLQEATSNVQALDGLVTQFRRLQEHLAKSRPADSALDSLTSNMTSVITHVQNRGTYETLKAQGVDLVRNDSLRLQITGLYEAHYRLLDTIDTQALVVWERWTQAVSQRFVMGDLSARPRNYAALLNDTEFAHQLDWRIMYLTLLKRIEMELQGRIERVLASVEAEIARSL